MTLRTADLCMPVLPDSVLMGRGVGGGGRATGRGVGGGDGEIGGSGKRPAPGKGCGLEGGGIPAAGGGTAGTKTGGVALEIFGRGGCSGPMAGEGPAAGNGGTTS